MAEKGISMDVIDLSVVKGEQKHPDFMSKNSRGQVPVLELENGRTISESISICRYLDEMYPDPPLFGTNAFERASIDMWVRRIELNVMAPVGLYWAHAHPFTARVVKQFKDFGESNQSRWEGAATWLNGELIKQDFIAGSEFTIADIAAITTIDFAIWIGLKVPHDCDALTAWYDRMSQRPSLTSLRA
jgi:glutathione S-transferase